MSYPYQEEPHIGQTEDNTPTGPPIINGVVTESDIKEIKERSNSLSCRKSNPSKDSGFHDHQEVSSVSSGETAAAGEIAAAAAAGDSAAVPVISDGSSGAVSFGLGGDEADDDEEDEDSSEQDQVMEMPANYHSRKRNQISKDKLQLDLGDDGTSMQSHRDMIMSKSPSMPAMSTMYKPGAVLRGTPVDPPPSYGTEECPFWCPPTYAQIRHYAQSPVLQFRHLPIATNPYMSPFLAPEELIRSLPKTCFVVSTLCFMHPAEESHKWCTFWHVLNVLTLVARQNHCHFADVFNCVSVNEN